MAAAAAAAPPPTGSVEADPEAAAIDESRLGSSLIASAKAGDVESAKSLLESGAPAGFTDSGGWSSLTWAASEGHTEVVALLLEQEGVAPEADSAKAGEGLAVPTDVPAMNNNPMHWAAYKGHTHIVWKLLTAGFSPRLLDTEGNTALHLASAGNHWLILQSMLSQGLDVTAKNAYGNTPLKLTTDATCQTLLRRAMAAAVEGKTYLCSCCGEFVGAAESVAATVTDRVSKPTPRPVRYAHASAANIKAAEEALDAAIKAADTEALEAAITAAEETGAAIALLEGGTAALARLQAQIALQAAVAQLDGQRPLKDRMAIRPLLQPLKAARANGVQPQLIEGADRLLQTVDAEAALIEVREGCDAMVMVDDGPTEAEPPPATSDFHRRAETGVAQLAAAIANAQSVEAMEEVVQSAEQLHRRLTGELEMRLGLLEPEEGPGEEEGSVAWTHHNGTKTHSVLEKLQLRNDQFDSAIDKCAAEGTLETILEKAYVHQKDLKELLKTAVAEDEERKAKEAAAAAKAAKKKKGGGKGKK